MVGIMRLIDADLLLSSIDKRYNEKVNIVPDNLAEGFVQMEKLIKEQPTSYDTDKIVKQIENIEVSKDSNGVVNGCNQGICRSDDCLKCLKKKVIEIIKAGGKDE